jgi:hypothetical protein
MKINHCRHLWERRSDAGSRAWPAPASPRSVQQMFDAWPRRDAAAIRTNRVAKRASDNGRATNQSGRRPRAHASCTASARARAAAKFAARVDRLIPAVFHGARRLTRHRGRTASSRRSRVGRGSQFRGASVWRCGLTPRSARCATGVAQAATCTKALTMSSTIASISALSSPSPMTRMTGSVPDGRITSRP